MAVQCLGEIAEKAKDWTLWKDMTTNVLKWYDKEEEEEEEEEEEGQYWYFYEHIGLHNKTWYSL